VRVPGEGLQDGAPESRAGIFVIAAHGVGDFEGFVDGQVLRGKNLLQRLHAGKGVCDDLLHARARQDVADTLAEFEQRFRPVRRYLAPKQSRRHLVVTEHAGDLLDHVISDRDVGAPVGHTDDVAVGRQPAATETEALENLADQRCRDLHAEDFVSAPG
jgi:hypothetical protein